MHMNYQRIRYFLAAAENESFSKAAAKSYISPQAFTKQISLLEDELGGVLFHRSSHGSTLTALGQYAYERFSKIDQELTLSTNQIQQFALTKKSQINIGFFSSLPQGNLVTPLITFILGRYPQYRININMVELDEGKLMLLNGQLDLLFTNTHEEDDWDGYEMQVFSSHLAKVVVSLLHPWSMKDSVTIQDLSQETFLKMHMPDSHYLLPVQNSFFSNVPCKEVEECNNFNTLMALLFQGKGFAVFPAAFAHMDQAKIKFFDYPNRDFWFHTALLYKKEGISPDLLSLTNDICQEFDLHQL